MYRRIKTSRIPPPCSLRFCPRRPSGALNIQAARREQASGKRKKGTDPIPPDPLRDLWKPAALKKNPRAPACIVDGSFRRDRTQRTARGRAHSCIGCSSMCGLPCCSSCSTLEAMVAPPRVIPRPCIQNLVLGSLPPVDETRGSHPTIRLADSLYGDGRRRRAEHQRLPREHGAWGRMHTRGEQEKSSRRTCASVTEIRECQGTVDWSAHSTRELPSIFRLLPSSLPWNSLACCRVQLVFFLNIVCHLEVTNDARATARQTSFDNWISCHNLILLLVCCLTCPPHSPIVPATYRSKPVSLRPPPPECPTLNNCP